MYIFKLFIRFYHQEADVRVGNHNCLQVKVKGLVRHESQHSHLQFFFFKKVIFLLKF